MAKAAIRSVIPRKGSFFNPEYPAPSGGRANIQIRIFDVINGALAMLQRNPQVVVRDCRLGDALEHGPKFRGRLVELRLLQMSEPEIQMRHAVVGIDGEDLSELRSANEKALAQLSRTTEKQFDLELAEIENFLLSLYRFAVLAVRSEQAIERDRTLRLLASRQDSEPVSEADHEWLLAHLAGCPSCDMAHAAMLEASVCYRAWPREQPTATG